MIPLAGRKRQSCQWWVEVEIKSATWSRPRRVMLCDLTEATRPLCEACARYRPRPGAEDVSNEDPVLKQHAAPADDKGNGKPPSGEHQTVKPHPLDPPKAPDPDLVNHPPHYCLGTVEVIDAIEAWTLGFHEGNVVKYVARAQHKGERLRDLEKASWYLNRLIRRLGGKPAGLE